MTLNHYAINVATGESVHNAKLAKPRAIGVGQNIATVKSILMKALKVLKANEAVFNVFVVPSFQNEHHAVERWKAWLTRYSAKQRSDFSAN